jgi:hypothetical protein
LLIDHNGDEIGRWLIPDHDDQTLKWIDWIPQETLFWRRSMWDKVGGCVDETFKFAMDWDLLIRFSEVGARFAHIPRFLGAFRVRGSQKTTASINDLGAREMDRIRQRTLGRVPTQEEIDRTTKPFLARHVRRDIVFRIKQRLALV